MDAKELKEIVERHGHWLREDCDGWESMRADLRGADLRGADLRGADLGGADLRGADLSGAYLRGAYLIRADLRGAYLIRADLSGADLRGADLSGADLIGADLRGADLRGADLIGADLIRAKIENDVLNKYFPIACPDSGSFTGWKKCRDGAVVKLLILANAKRSSAFGRKCRCSAAKVVEITNVHGDQISEAVSCRDSRFVYRVGEIVSVDDFDDDRKNECSTGIHFFITRQEAEDYDA